MPPKNKISIKTYKICLLRAHVIGVVYQKIVSKNSDGESFLRLPSFAEPIGPISDFYSPSFFYEEAVFLEVENPIRIHPLYVFFLSSN